MKLASSAPTASLPSNMTISGDSMKWFINCSRKEVPNRTMNKAFAIKFWTEAVWMGIRVNWVSNKRDVAHRRQLMQMQGSVGGPAPSSPRARTPAHPVNERPEVTHEAILGLY